MQFGPTRTAPAARTRSTTTSSRRLPSAELSPRPAVIATIALAPTASDASTVSSNALAGIASTTSSGCSGNSSRERYVSCPSTVPPVRLIRKTERRCAPSRALRASHCPHFDGSLEAPTTATECGSKSARRSRLLPAAISGHLRIADEWSLTRVSERDPDRIPEIQRVTSLARGEDRLPLFLGEGTDAAGALVGPARQAFGLLLGGAPEEARPLEVAAGERDLREAGERVERPQAVLLRAFHLERDEPFSLGLLEIVYAKAEHQELVPLARLPPRPPGGTAHLSPTSCELDRPSDIAVVERKLPQQPVVRRLDEGEPALGELHGVFSELSHAVPVLEPPGRHRLHLLDERYPSVIAELPVELDALLRQPHGHLVVAGQVGGAALGAQHACEELQRDVARAVAEALDPLEALPRAGRVPELLELDRELETEVRVVLLCPVERGAQVLAFRDQEADVRLGIVHAEAGGAGDFEHPPGVTPTQVVFASRLAEPLDRELANCLEHPVALLAEPPGAAAEKALVEQGGERVEVGLAHELRRLERAAAAERAEAREQCLLVLVEQVVRPGDGRPERQVALLGVARSLERVEAVGEPVEECLRREQLRPGGCELEREREAVELLAELYDGVRRGDVGPNSLRALAEERHGLVAVEWREVELELAAARTKLL